MNLKKGVSYVLLASVISGISIFYNKLVIVKGIDSTVFNIYKNGGAAIILSLILIVTSYSKIKVELKNNLPKSLILGIIGGSIPFILFFEGLKGVSALEANLIQKSMFLWVIPLAFIFLKEKVKHAQIIGYLVLVYANFFLPGFNGLIFNDSALLIFGATLLWSLEQVIVKKFIKDTSSLYLSWSRMTFGVFFMFLFLIFQNKLNLLFSFKPDILLPIAGSITLLSLYVIFWYKSLKYLPVTVVTSLLILATPVTNILNGVFINGAIPDSTLISSLVISIGVFLISLFTVPKNRVQKSLSV